MPLPRLLQPFPLLVFPFLPTALIGREQERSRVLAQLFDAPRSIGHKVMERLGIQITTHFGSGGQRLAFDFGQHAYV